MGIVAVRVRGAAVRIFIAAILLGGGAAAFARHYLARPVAGYAYDAAGRRYDSARLAERSESSPGASRRLTVLTWNIAYAYGLGSEAYSFEPRGEAAFAGKLAQIARVIRDAKPDLVLLQEVDFRSRRSHYRDQLAELQRACGFPYAAAAVSWSARFVPYPPWPPGRQVGPIASGGALLSRFPLREHEVIYHPQPAANPAWYNAFYLRRYTQVAEISAFGRPFTVMNSHLEDTDAESRRASVESLIARIAGAQAPTLIAAGDLNAGPAEETVQALRRASRLEDAFLKRGRQDADPAAFTFPSHAPDRRIDHVFVRRGVAVESLEVLDAGDLSDHLPVLITVRIPRG